MSKSKVWKRSGFGCRCEHQNKSAQKSKKIATQISKFSKGCWFFVYGIGPLQDLTSVMSATTRRSNGRITSSNSSTSTQAFLRWSMGDGSTWNLQTGFCQKKIKERKQNILGSWVGCGSWEVTGRWKLNFDINFN